MKTGILVAIILLSGAVSGLVYSGANLFIVEPVLDEAIALERQNSDDGLSQAEYEEYRNWQKGGQVLAGAVFGIAVGSIFGIIYAYTYSWLPGNGALPKAFALSGIMWATLVLVPFLKYPTSPPGFGSEETLVARTMLYLVFLGISGGTFAALYAASRRLQGARRILLVVAYIAVMAVVGFVMPENPDGTDMRESLVGDFGIASMLSYLWFWVMLPFLLGCLWNRFKRSGQLSGYAE